MRIVAVALALLIAGLAVAYVAMAAGTAPAQSIGVVGVEQILREYEKAKKSNAELRAMEQRMNDQNKLMRQHRLLSGQEMQEYIKLIAIEKPTPANQTRLSALEDLEKRRELRLQSLQSEKDPTDQQKQELMEFQGYANDSAKAIDAATYNLNKQLVDRNNLLNDEVVKDIKVAVGVIAQESNTPVVFDKAAVIVGGVDLTEKTLKRLNSPKAGAAK